MRFVSIIFSYSYSLSFRREIKQNEDQDTTKEYVCLHTMGIFLYCKQLISDRLTDHHQQPIIHLALQDELAEKQILFLLQIMAWGKIIPKEPLRGKAQISIVK